MYVLEEYEDINKTNKTYSPVMASNQNDSLDIQLNVSNNKINMQRVICVDG